MSAMAEAMDTAAAQAGDGEEAAPAENWASDTLDVVWISPNEQTAKSFGQYVLENASDGTVAIETPIPDLDIGLGAERVVLVWGENNDLAWSRASSSSASRSPT
jgi:hypothetical protein